MSENDKSPSKNSMLSEFSNRNKRNVKDEQNDNDWGDESRSIERSRSRSISIDNKNDKNEFNNLSK